MRRLWLPATLVALASMAAAGPAVQTRRSERSVPFRAGETLTFDVSWSQFVTAGTATITVRDKRPSFDSTAYYIVAEGRPTPILARLYTLYYKADTLLDAFTLLPQRGSVYSEEGSRRSLKATRFDQKARRGAYEVTSATVVKKNLELPPFTQDPLSAIFVIRALPLKLGATQTMPVADSGKIYRVKVEVVAQEALATPLGSLVTWKIVPTILDDQGTPAAQAMSLWISDDARRLPVKLEAALTVGRFVLVLKEARE